MTRHSARPGAVDEASWPGATGSFDTDPNVRHTLSVNNPGGLAAVWTTQNTREAIFAALERRETYATSGPRIALRFFQSNDQADLCTSDAEPVDATLMGGTMVGSAAPTFYVRAMKDRAPLSRIDLIKLWVTDGQVRQSITPYVPDDVGASELCARFVDKQYDAGTPALWYARVLEVSTARWRSFTGKSDETVQERAWSSPIWNNSD